MVILTARAGALLRSLQDAQADASLPRLTLANGAFSIDISPPVANDEVVSHAGAPVLLLAKDAAAALAGNILTARDLPNGPVLVIMPATMARSGRGRPLTVGGRARLTTAFAVPQGSYTSAGVRERTRQRVADDESSGVSATERAYCDACQQARPAAGSVQDGRYALCNVCALEYALAGAHGLAVTAGQFVRDKVFGETSAYLLQDAGAPDVPAGAGAIRPLVPSAVRGQRNRRVNLGSNGATTPVRRPVIRLPRRRAG